MGKKKINAKNNIREFPYEGVRRDNRIKELAKQLKIKPFHLKNLLDQKLKPGVKVMGKRFFSNVDTMAGYLNEVGKKNLANTPRSEVKPTYDPAMNVYGITDAQKLKYLSKAHGFHPSIIYDALKAGARPKMLIKMMMHEGIPSDVVSKHIREATGEQWKKSNKRKRSAKEIKNKIVSSDQLSSKPSQKMFKAIADGIPESERVAANRRLLKKSANIRMQKGITSPGLRNIQQFLAPNIPKSSRLKTGMSGGVKGDVMSTAASIIADVLGERVIDPLTKKLVEKTIGPQLIKIREHNDEQRKRKQSL